MTSPPTPRLVDRIGAFATVPMRFINESNVGPSAFRVYVYLRSCVNTLSGDDMAFPSYDTIMQKCRIGSRKTLSIALRELLDEGWIVKRRRFGKSTLYDLVIAKTASSSESELVPSSSLSAPISSSLSAPISSSLSGTLTRRTELHETKNQTKGERASAPRPAARARGFGIVFTQSDDPRVAAYLSTIKPEITQTNAALIAERVKLENLTEWQATLTLWAASEWKPQNFAGMFERYEGAVNGKRIRATAPPAALNGHNGRNGKSYMLPQVPDPTPAEFAAAEARAKAQREARNGI